MLLFLLFILHPPGSGVLSFQPSLFLLTITCRYEDKWLSPLYSWGNQRNEKQLNNKDHIQHDVKVWLEYENKYERNPVEDRKAGSNMVTSSVRTDWSCDQCDKIHSTKKNCQLIRNCTKNISQSEKSMFWLNIFLN